MNSKTAIAHLLSWCLIIILLPQLVLFFLFSDRKQDKRVETFYGVAEQLEAVTLGSSHTRAIHYPSMGLKGFSFAEDGGDIELAEFKMRLLDDYATNLKYIFIPIAPGLLSYNRIEALPDEFPYDYIRFAPWPQSFSELSIKEKIWLASAHFLILKEAAITANEQMKKFIRTTISPNNGNKVNGGILCQFIVNPPDHPDEDGIPGGFARTPVDASCMTPAWIEADAQRRLTMFENSLKNSPDALKKNIASLKSIAKNANVLGAELVIVISPTVKAYFDQSDLQTFWDKELPELKKLQSLDNVTMIDIHEEFFDYSFKNENLFFSDPDHISFEGAKLFSKKLRKALDTQLH